MKDSQTHNNHLPEHEVPSQVGGKKGLASARGSTDNDAVIVLEQVEVGG